MLAPELQQLSETVENLRGLAELRGLLEEGACAPISYGKRLAAEANELIRPRDTHRRELNVWHVVIWAVICATTGFGFFWPIFQREVFGGDEALGSTSSRASMHVRTATPADGTGGRPPEWNAAARRPLFSSRRWTTGTAAHGTRE